MARANAKLTAQRRQRRSEPAIATNHALKPTLGRTTARETPLDIRVHGLDLDASLGGYLRKRIGFKLGKFALQITRITVRFENISGPADAPTVACRFNVLLPAKVSVILESTDEDAKAAFDEAVDATARAVRRRLDKRHTKRIGRRKTL